MLKKFFSTVSAEMFRDDAGRYVFPFAPGSKIVWGIELAVREIKEDDDLGPATTFSDLLVFAHNTLDPRYHEKLRAKVFHIPGPTRELAGYAGLYRGQRAFLECVKRVSVCEDHNLPVLLAEPYPEHRCLVIGSAASLGCDAYFADEAP